MSKINTKIKTPSQIFSFHDSKDVVEKLNQIIDETNLAITSFNTKIDNKKQVTEEILRKFWVAMRHEYDGVISNYLSQLADRNIKIQQKTIALKAVNDCIANITSSISEMQTKTVNIDTAIEHINAKLIDLGITSFSLVKHKDYLYRIVREHTNDNDFHTLSEGEKTVISFIYFLELCKGKKSATDVSSKKIIVIDDPISSLSHIYVFNIGRMIKNELFKSPQFEHILVLTHSLYFFYELTIIDHEKRKESQQLFRIIKNPAGSKIIDMKYEEIQNDYQSYWSIIKDSAQPVALIANCMRNVIEYFFNFVAKRDLNNVFLQKNLEADKYQSFYRFINRESHSLGQNIFDYKEFDYSSFQDAFKLVFEESGFSEHYQKMMK